MDSTSSVDPNPPKHAEETNPDRLFSPSVDILFQESLLYTSISLRRNVLARISLRGQRRLIWSIHYADAIMLVFSRDGSFINVKFLINPFTDTVILQQTILKNLYKLK